MSQLSILLFHSTNHQPFQHGPASLGWPAPARLVHDRPGQSPEQKSHTQRRRDPAWGSLADFRPVAPYSPGAPAWMQFTWRPARTLWWLQSVGQRIFLRPPPSIFQLNSQLLSHGKAPSGGRNVRLSIQRWLGVLGDRWALLGSMLPAQISPEKRACTWGNAKRGWIAQDQGWGGFWRRQVCTVPKVSLGPTGETNHFHSGEGKMNIFAWKISFYSTVNTQCPNVKLRCCLFLGLAALNWPELEGCIGC